MPYIIVKFAKPEINNNYFTFDPTIAITTDFSCHNTYVGRQNNIKPYYENSEHNLALEDCNRLNIFNPVGHYEVCKVLTNPDFKIAFIGNLDPENVLLTLGRGGVYNSLDDLFSSDYIVKNIQEFIREKNFYLKEPEYMLLVLYEVFLKPTKLINTYSLQFHMSLTHRKIKKIVNFDFTFNKCYISPEILEDKEYFENSKYILSKRPDGIAITICDKKLTDLIKTE